MAMSTSSSSPPPTSPHRSRRHTRPWARRFERYCCLAATYFPLAFVYGLSTWAVYVEAEVGLRAARSKRTGPVGSIIGIVLYVFLNLCYTVAVFTDPGSPLSTHSNGNTRGGYSHLPTTELPEYTSYTANSSGGSRYCKKCQCPKPDRTHHCSTCKRCVLKMDHHCPWLATCVGLRNYKAFLLFLIYTSVFCWLCFAAASFWLWDEIISGARFTDVVLPINVVLLAVLGGVIGLVLAGFTFWHISLAARGLTTIESLQKTRYLFPVRKTLDRHRVEYQRTNSTNAEQIDESFRHRLQNFGQKILDAHANAIPGVTRAEEGEDCLSPPLHNWDSNVPRSTGPNNSRFSAQRAFPSPAQQALYRSYAALERQRDRERYEEYVDEQDNEKMPNAFDLGWRQNLKHLFGENPFLWFFPICNTTGDGWFWEPSPAFLEARERVRQKREQYFAEYLERERNLHRTNSSNGFHGSIEQPVPPQRIESTRIGSNQRSMERPTTGVSMKTLPPMSPRLRPRMNGYEANADADGDSSPCYDSASDEEASRNRRNQRVTANSAIFGMRSDHDVLGAWRD